MLQIKHETRPPETLQHRYHWLASERATDRIICEWVPATQRWLPGGEKEQVTPEDMWRRGWHWSAAVGANSEPARVTTYMEEDTPPTDRELVLMITAVCSTGGPDLIRQVVRLLERVHA